MNRKQIAEEFSKSINYPEIEKIILFGSVARGEDTGDSDIVLKHMVFRTPKIIDF